MRITITSKNQEKTFDDADGNVINIGNSNRCHFKLDIGEPLLLSLQKMKTANGRLLIIRDVTKFFLEVNLSEP